MEAICFLADKGILPLVVGEAGLNVTWSSQGILEYQKEALLVLDLSNEAQLRDFATYCAFFKQTHPISDNLDEILMVTEYFNIKICLVFL